MSNATISGDAVVATCQFGDVFMNGYEDLIRNTEDNIVKLAAIGTMALGLIKVAMENPEWAQAWLKKSEMVTKGISPWLILAPIEVVTEEWTSSENIDA